MTLPQITFDPLILGIDPIIHSNILQHLLDDLNTGLNLGKLTPGFALPLPHT